MELCFSFLKHFLIRAAVRPSAVSSEQSPAIPQPFEDPVFVFRGIHVTAAIRSYGEPERFYDLPLKDLRAENSNARAGKDPPLSGSGE